MKKYIAVLAMLTFASHAMAATPKPVSKPLDDSREVKKETRQDLKDTKTEVKQDAKEAVKELKQEVKMTRDEAKKDLKSKISKIKDSKKRKALDKIGSDIDALNKKTTDQFLSSMNKLTDILMRTNKRADNAIAKGIDVTNAKTAIATAQTSIANTISLINAQAAKGYSIDVTDLATLKQKTGETRQALRDDLKAVQDAMANSKEAVRTAAKTLAQTSKINEVPEEVAPVTASTTNQQ